MYEGVLSGVNFLKNQEWDGIAMAHLERASFDKKI